MFRYYLQWSKVIQYAANQNEKSGRPKCLQNSAKENGYGKTYLHINHQYLILTCDNSIAVLRKV